MKTLTAGTSRSSPPLTGPGLPPPREPFVARKVVVQPPSPTPPPPPAIHRKQTRVVTDQQRLRQPIPRVHEGGYIHVPDLAASYAARNQPRKPVRILPKSCSPPPPPKRPLAASTIVKQPPPAPQMTLLLAPPTTLLVVQTPPDVPPELADAAVRTKKRQRVKEEERVYKKTKTHNVCRQCGYPKLKETGHKGFKGYSHCPLSVETYDDFLTRVKSVIGEKKKKDPQ